MNNTMNRMSRTKTIHIRNNYNKMKMIGTERIFYGPTPLTLPTTKFRPTPILWAHATYPKMLQTHSTHAEISTDANFFEPRQNFTDLRHPRTHAI